MARHERYMCGSLSGAVEPERQRIEALAAVFVDSAGRELHTYVKFIGD